MRYKFKISRTAILAGVFIILCLVIIGRLYVLQIVEGASYAEHFQMKTTRTLELKSSRGNIYDKNGKLLAGNELTHTATLEDNGVYQSNREQQLSLNSTAYQIVQVLRENGDKLNNELKIILNKNGGYEYSVDGVLLQRFKADIFGKADSNTLDQNEAEMKAHTVVEFLASEERFSLYSENEKPYTDAELKKYGLKREFEKDELLGIIGIRYMLFLNSYQRYIPITVAENISPETEIYLLENQERLRGVDVKDDWIRVYKGGEEFAHLLGYTGKISMEELDDFKEENIAYSPQSIVGKSGIEQYMEDTLQGRDGEKEVFVNNVGRILEEGQKKRDPVAGNDVYLSIDKELQTATYKMLEQRIAGILASNIINTKEFDKKSVQDTSEIKIPIADVYNALFENGVLDLEEIYDENATQLEQNIAKKLTDRKKQILSELEEELTGEGVIYKELKREMQDYQLFTANNLDLIQQDAINKKDEDYLSWMKEEDISLQQYLRAAIQKEWIDLSSLPLKDGYLSSQEIYQTLIEEILKRLDESDGFHRKIMKYMILDDRISGTEICNILYDQGVIDQEKDEDYARLQDGSIDSYEFMMAKIQKIQITPAQLALDPYSGSAVVVEAKTGKVLACVTYPGYDNNRLANVMDNEYYYQLYQDLSAPFYNRATQQLTAPGSTFKPVTVIAGMEEGVITSDTSVLCDGVFDLVEPPLKCWNTYGHGPIANAAGALENSCNDYLCDISFRLGQIGKEEFDDDQALGYLQKYSDMFNLDKKSGIEITESDPQVTDFAAIPSAIGQGTHNYSTVQVARYANTLAERGKSFTLSLLRDDQGPDAQKSIDYGPKIESEISLPDEVWNTVESGMRQYIKSTELFKNVNLSVAGKSGTAQEAEDRPDHALFIGYAPVEDPEITVSARIANGYASGNAVALGKDVLSYYFKLSSDDLVTGQASAAFNIRTD